MMIINNNKQFKYSTSNLYNLYCDYKSYIGKTT